MSTEFNFTSIRSKATERLYKKYCKASDANYNAEKELIKSQMKDCESKKAKDLAKTYEGKWFIEHRTRIIYAHKAKFVSYGTENLALCIEGWNFIEPGNVQYNDRMYFVGPMQGGLGAEIPASKIAAVLKKKGYDLDMFKMFIKLSESK
jgi:hypothetical protein